MSCNHCNVKFNFFHKEMGCGNCGLSFCNKCVKLKSKIPSKGNTEANVCRVCFMNLASGASSQAIPPPDTFKKRLESLENSGNEKQDKKPIDMHLMERLEKLKDPKKDIPSDNELRKRLASLKDNNYVEGPSRNIFMPDKRTDAQKADSLLEQFLSEREIELAHNPQEEIEARLATLREKGIRPNEGPYLNNLVDSSSEEEVDMITKKIMDQVALEERCPVPLSKSNLTEVSNEEDPRLSPELPWCVLCNNDAKYRCLDCGNDLYCAQCNIEVHQTWGDNDHKVIHFKPK